MQAELASRLRRVMKGDTIPKSGVTGVTGYVSKPLKLQRLRGLRHENSKGENNDEGGVTDVVTAACDLDPSSLEERKGMAMGSVPEPYLDAWARFQLQRPAACDEPSWLQAINDAGLFLDRWGVQADALGFTPGDLFDAPHDGLVWFMKGSPAVAMGPGFVKLQGGRLWQSARTKEQH